MLAIFPRRYRQLLLRPGPPHEAAPHPHDPQPAAQLRAVPQDGDLPAAQGHAGGDDKVPLGRLHQVPQVRFRGVWSRKE